MTESLGQDEKARLQKRLDDLAQVGGPEARDRLLGRFRDQLKHQLGLCAEDVLALGEEAHRLAGLAGMFGFESLERACRALEETPDDHALATAACRQMEAALEIMP